MYDIEYGIDLNEYGRPYITLPEDYGQRPEDRFFVIELTRFIIQDLIVRRGENVDDKTNDLMDKTERFLGQVSDEMSVLIYKGMKDQGLIDMHVNVKYHIHVDSVESRDELPSKNILYNGKLYNRMVGLKVCVISYNEDIAPIYDIYELVNGIENENWVKL